MPMFTLPIRIIITVAERTLFLERPVNLRMARSDTVIVTTEAVLVVAHTLGDQMPDLSILGAINVNPYIVELPTMLWVREAVNDSL